MPSPWAAAPGPVTQSARFVTFPRCGPRRPWASVPSGGAARPADPELRPALVAESHPRVLARHRVRHRLGRAAAEAARPRVADGSRSDAGNAKHQAARVLQSQARPATSRDGRVSERRRDIWTGALSASQGSRRLVSIRSTARTAEVRCACRRASKAVSHVGAAGNCWPTCEVIPHQAPAARAHRRPDCQVSLTDRAADEHHPRDIQSDGPRPRRTHHRQPDVRAVHGAAGRRRQRARRDGAWRDADGQVVGGHAGWSYRVGRVLRAEGTSGLRPRGRPAMKGVKPCFAAPGPREGRRG
jgi:hypothetical protein